MKTQETRIVIIGAGYAGMLAALRVARKTKRQSVTITMVNASDRFVERIRLHQLATGQSLRERPLQHMLRGTNINFVQGWVTALSPSQKRLTIQAAQGIQELAYDKLIYALGSYSRRPSGDNVYTFDQASAATLTGYLPEIAKRGGRVVVVGGGLTGIEGATEIAETYPQLRVTLVTQGQLGSDLAKVGQTYLHKIFQTLNITLREGITVTGVAAQQAQLSDGTNLPFDVCLWTAGFEVSPVARQAGLAVNTCGQVIIDATMRSVSHPDIYAIGDAAVFAPETGLSLRMACATGMPMGAHAADNLTAALRQSVQKPFRFGYVFRCISLGRKRGLLQVTRPDDAPARRILTGRAAALFKEMLCRYTTISLWSARYWNFYWWPRTLPRTSVAAPIPIEG